MYIVVYKVYRKGYEEHTRCIWVVYKVYMYIYICEFEVSIGVNKVYLSCT